MPLTVEGGGHRPYGNGTEVVASGFDVDVCVNVLYLKYNSKRFAIIF